MTTRFTNYDFLHDLVRLAHCLKKSFGNLAHIISLPALFYSSQMMFVQGMTLDFYLTSSCCRQAVWVYPQDGMRGPLWSREGVPSGSGILKGGVITGRQLRKVPYTPSCPQTGDEERGRYNHTTGGRGSRAQSPSCCFPRVGSDLLGEVPLFLRHVAHIQL